MRTALENMKAAIDDVLDPWLPIALAPHDEGVDLLLALGNDMRVGYWNARSQSWSSAGHEFAPSHFMPLPKRPIEGGA